VVTVTSSRNDGCGLLPTSWSIKYLKGPADDISSDRTLWSDENNFVVTAAGPHRFRVSFPTVAQFEIDFSSEAIRIAAGDCARPETIRHLLADQILPRIITHKGGLVLHASAVSSTVGALLFIGPSGSGKSTLAASMHASGFSLLGDDAIIISDVGNALGARAVYRSLRLFPDSIEEVLDASSAKISSIASYTTKRKVENLDRRPPDGPVPVRAVFLLESAGSAQIRIQRVASADTCIAFVEHSFWMDPTDLTRTKERMTQASALAAGVPTFRLTYPRDYSALSAVHDTIAGVLD
jgi:hypothetical protein